MIKSIRIRNFRSIKEATFKPAEEGITSILGATGAGKSTILTATLFALYGIRPERVSQKDLRRDGSTSKDECSVSVLLTHQGDEVEVIRELKGASGTISAYVYVNGVEVASPSAKVVNKWVKDRLGVDANGFLTAFVVRQKELENIVSALPSERKKQIEKLAGIDTLGDALKRAREDEKQTTDLLSNLPGSKESVQSAEQMLNAQQGNATDFFEEYDAAAKIVETERERLVSFNEQLKEMTSLGNTLSQVENNIKNFQRLIENTQVLYQSVKYVETADDNFDLDELRAKHKELYREESEVRSKHDSILKAHQEQTLKIEQLSQAIDNFNRPPVELLELDGEEIIAKLEQMKQDAIEAQQVRSLALSRRQDLLDSIKQLEHSAECPTCHTVLDEKGDLLGTLQDSADKYQNEAGIAETKIIELKASYEELQKTNNERQLAVTADAEYQKLVGDLELENLAPISLDEIPTLKEKMVELQAKLQESTEHGIRMKNLKNDRDVFERTKEELSRYQQQLTEQEIQQEELKLKYDKDKAADLVQSYNRADAEFRNANHKLKMMDERKQDADRKIAIAEASLRSATEQWNMKKDLLEKAEKQALTRDIIEKYRLNIISALTPELSENASILISEMTSGAFVSVNIDEDFSITAENKKGQIRRVSELSGGEEAAVALSLRLAVASLITGGVQEIAWLDEVLTAQDPDRRASMLSTIRSLDIKQIIMINHTQEAADIADHIVTMSHGTLYEGGDVPISEDDDEPVTEKLVDGGVLDDWELLSDD